MRQIIPVQCELHGPLGSEPPRFKNPDSRAPDLGRKLNTCTVPHFPCGKLCAHYSLRSSVPETSQSHTNSNSLGFLYVHTLKAKRKQRSGAPNKEQRLSTGITEPRLIPCAILHPLHLKQSRTSLLPQPSAVILKTLHAHIR